MRQAPFPDIRVQRAAIRFCGVVLAACSAVAQAQSPAAVRPSPPATATSTAAAPASVPLPAGMTRVTAVEGITEYALPNGLHILTLPDASKPSTTVNLTVKVGSRMENYGETGMAHLLEHLMFKGTPTHRDPKKEMSDRGLEWNGSTSDDRTNYFASMAENPEHLDFYLHWLSDALTQSFIARKDLDSEMTVVRNEMESGENNPGNILFQDVLAASFHWHAYGKATIGARSDVENVSIPRLQAFYRNYYQPDNAVLIVAGKFDEAKTLAIIASTFGKIPRPKRVIEPTYTLDPTQDGEKSVTLRRPATRRSSWPSTTCPPARRPTSHRRPSPRRSSAAPTSGCTRALVAANLAADTGGGAQALAEPGYAYFEADMKNDQSIDAARDALLATVEDVGRAPFTQPELDRAKNIWLRRFTQTLDDPQRVGLSLSGVHRGRRLAARLRPARPDQGSDAGRRQPRRDAVLRHQQPHARHLHPEARHPCARRRR